MPSFGEDRYFRLLKPRYANPPKLGELEGSPWRHNPRDSYQAVVPASSSSNVLTEDPSAGSPTRGFNVSTPKRAEGKFVNVEVSPDLGDLSKYAADSELYHPDLYEDETVGKPQEKSPQLLGVDDSAQGVFGGKDDVYNSRRSNALSFPEPVQLTPAPAAQSEITRASRPRPFG